MKAVLLRAGSVPVTSPALPGSPSVPLRRRGSFSGVCSVDKVGSPIISLHFPMDNKRKPKEARSQMRRALSDTDIIRSETRLPGGSRCFTTGIPEEEYVSDCELDGEFRSSTDLMFPGDGFGTGGKYGGDRGDDSFGGDKSEIGDYYRKMLKQNPGDSLLLRNYGRYLHEVEKDMERAEEYYGRAILASPGDGEVLSLYGKLIWEQHRDGSRAKSYFDRAVTASPDDCMVLGSYANFLWDAEEEDDDEEEVVGVPRPMVAAL